MKKQTKESLDRYVTKGISPGGFLTAVLENDLMGAFARADDQNTLDMHEIVRYVYNEMPGACHGSDLTVEAWMRGVSKNV